MEHSDPTTGGAADPSENGAGPAVSGNGEQDIQEPRDSDVLCGRGGAALRHPGNQTYRRLVNLNKGLYITCLKTEKLKISRSIVAAIREQNGRFLEKDAKKGTWYDIGDKKAVEKTSQALREGQPKLRQKIVEMGGAPGGSTGFMEAAQYGNVGSGMYNSDQVLGLSSGGSNSGGLGGMANHPGAPQSASHQLQQQQQDRNHISIPASMRRHEMQAMQPPQPLVAPMARHPLDLDSDILINRLSLNDVSSVGGGSVHDDPHRTMMLQQQQYQRQGGRMRPPSFSNRVQMAHDLGMLESHLSLMSSDISSYQGSVGSNSMGLGPLGYPMETSLANMTHLSQESSFQRKLANLPSLNHTNQETSFQRKLASLSGHQTFAQYGGVGLEPYYGPSMSSSGSTFSNTTPIPLPIHNNGFVPTPPGAMLKDKYLDMDRHNSSGGGGGGSGGGGGGGGGGGFGGSVPAPSGAAAKDKFADMDRRRVFAKMKYNRPPSVSGARSNPQGFPFGMDGAPDFQMVESSLSLRSNLSNMTGGESAKHLNGESSKQIAIEGAPFAEMVKVVDHSRPSVGYNEVFGSGSRHSFMSGSRQSIMSGLSRISDTSVDHSIFSDLSRKIGNVSTRSMAMSEISAVDMQELENEDESCSNILSTLRNADAPLDDL